MRETTGSDGVESTSASACFLRLHLCEEDLDLIGLEEGGTWWMFRLITFCLIVEFLLLCFLLRIMSDEVGDDYDLLGYQNDRVDVGEFRCRIGG